MTVEPLPLRLARRQFLYQSLSGVGGLALLHMLNQEAWGGGLAARNPLAPKTPHHTPKAKACIFLSMLGHGLEQRESHRSAQLVCETPADIGQPVGVQEVWPVRHGCLRSVSTPGHLRR